MKLLICTQSVDLQDPNLGSFHQWIEEFAKHCEKVTIICLREGEHALPANVEVLSLGKEKGSLRLERIARFYRFIISRRRDYDAVFVHMNPEYVVLGGVLWRLWGKKVGLWYTHKSVDLKLRIATLFANVIFTASKESFRLSSKKVRVTGHGIDTGRFACPPRAKRASADPLRIITIGRISPTKHLSEMLGVLETLYGRGIPFMFTIVGIAATEKDRVYERSIRARAATLPFADTITFAGPKDQTEVARLLCVSDVFLNLSTTGSLDKAVLEAMSAGVVPVTTNEAFKDILQPHTLYVPSVDARSIANAIVHASTLDPAVFARYIEENHSLARLIPRLITAL